MPIVPIGSRVKEGKNFFTVRDVTSFGELILENEKTKRRRTEIPELIPYLEVIGERVTAQL